VGAGERGEAVAEHRVERVRRGHGAARLIGHGQHQGEGVLDPVGQLGDQKPLALLGQAPRVDVAERHRQAAARRRVDVQLDPAAEHGREGLQARGAARAHRLLVRGEDGGARRFGEDVEVAPFQYLGGRLAPGLQGGAAGVHEAPMRVEHVEGLADGLQHQPQRGAGVVALADRAARGGGQEHEGQPGGGEGQRRPGVARVLHAQAADRGDEEPEGERRGRRGAEEADPAAEQRGREQHRAEEGQIGVAGLGAGQGEAGGEGGQQQQRDRAEARPEGPSAGAVRDPDQPFHGGTVPRPAAAVPDGRQPVSARACWRLAASAQPLAPWAAARGS
jgi:hypothetical protein